MEAGESRKRRDRSHLGASEDRKEPEPGSAQENAGRWTRPSPLRAGQLSAVVTEARGCQEAGLSPSPMVQQ